MGIKTKKIMVMTLRMLALTGKFEKTNMVNVEQMFPIKSIKSPQTGKGYFLSMQWFY